MEPITFTAGAIAILILTEALKAGGQSLGKGTSELFVKLTEVIRQKFKEAKTEGILTQVQEQPTESNKSVFQTVLEMKMKEDTAFASQLEELFKQIKESQTTSQEILTDIEEVDEIEAENITQKAESSGSVKQAIAKNIKDAKRIKLKDISQEA